MLNKEKQMTYTFSIRTDDKRIIAKLDEDATKQDRSRNYILNDILKKHYELATER